MAGRGETQWYAIRVRPQQRQILRGKYATDPANAPFMVEHWLRLRGFDTFVPRKKVWRFPNKVGRTKREKVERAFPAMPGWAFVGWPKDENRWRALLDTPGVVAPGSFGLRPFKMDGAEMRQLAKRLGDGFLTAPERERYMQTYKEFAPGQPVKVTEGAFAERTVPVVKIAGRLATILVELFGQPHEVEIDAMLLEAA